jgi:hypothetical protein
MPFIARPAADCPVALVINPASQSDTPSVAMHPRYVPLAQRTSDQLRASADELRHMAAGATTADVKRALLALADRYAALAEKRRAQESL